MTRLPTTRLLSPTGPFEENPAVARAVADLTARAARGGASSIMFLPARGVKYEAYAFAYRTSLPKQLNIFAPKRAVRGTLVVNASGHVAGDLVDRLVAWAWRHGAESVVDGDAARFESLRAACAAVARKGGALDALSLLDGGPFASSAMGVMLGAAAASGASPGAAVIRIPGFELAIDPATFARLQRNDDAVLVSAGNDARRMHYASTNTYDVHVRAGDALIAFTVPRNDPSRIELATRVQLELPLTRGEVVLEAWPTGSAESRSYVEARRYVIHLGVDLFDVERALQVAQHYQAAHDDVRWNTEHEDHDLALHNAAPSPVPYQDF